MTNTAANGGIEWVVACIAPRDIGPHPNFRVDEVRGVDLLALMVQLRYSDYRDYRKRWPSDGDGYSDEHDLLGATELALDSDRADDGLGQLLTLGRNSDLDLGKRAAATLIASITGSEVERLEEPLELIRELLSQLPSTSFSTSSSGLAEAALSQQAAVRWTELGDIRHGRDYAERAIAAIENSGNDWDGFQTSQGVSWDAAESQRRIVELVRNNARGLMVATADGVPDSWTSLVRASPPIAELSPTRLMNEAFGEYVSELFKEQYSGTRSTHRIFRAGDPVITPLWASLINAELSGSLARIDLCRKILGKVLALRGGIGLEGEFVARHALRLLRQSESEDDLRRVLYTYRVQGPLSVIRHAAEQVLKRRRRPTAEDLALLEMSADLLPEDALGAAIASSFSYAQDTSKGRLGRRRTAVWRKVEISLKAATSLVRGSLVHEETAQRALATVEERGLVDKELTLGSLTRLAEAIDWSKVSKETTSNWLYVATRFESNTNVPPLELGRLFEVLTGGVRPTVLARLSGLERVAALVNGWLGAPPEPREITLSVDTCTEVLSDMTREADRQAYSGRTLAPIQLASYLIVDFSQDGLWEPVAKAISHPRVPIIEKLPAVRVLASAGTPPPSAVTKMLLGVVPKLSDLPQDAFFGGDADLIQVAWIRVILARRLRAADFYQLDLLRFSRSSNPDVRSEVAAVCGTVFKDAPASGWIASLLLQLSHDADGSVRHHAAKGLAVGSFVDSTYREVIRERVLELLGDPGIATVLGTVVGLKDAVAGQEERVVWCREELIEVSRSHESSNVRHTAKAALDMHE